MNKTTAMMFAALFAATPAMAGEPLRPADPGGAVALAPVPIDYGGVPKPEPAEDEGAFQIYTEAHDGGSHYKSEKHERQTSGKGWKTP